ncbi:MAG: cbb3-type cytochrome c oxidase subunit 3 [Pseudomonadota bacterium]
MLDTIVAWATTFWPLWLMILFLAIVGWAYWPKRKARFEEDAQIPLRDDDMRDG